MAKQMRGEESILNKVSGLRLSEAERRGIKGVWLESKGGCSTDTRVVGKLFVEMPGHADGITQTLGRI